MTQQEWVDLAINNVVFSPRLSRTTANVFIRQVRSNKSFAEQARAFFGERNIYHAEDYDVSTFVNATLASLRKNQAQPRSIEKTLPKTRLSNALSRGTWETMEHARKR